MKRILLQFIAVLLLLCVSICSNAQRIAINNSGMEADTSAMLDISSTTTGMLVPRMLQSQRTAIVLPATGLLVYQTDNTAGFYYYDGSVWQLISNVEGWGITGNGNTACTTNFIGTTNATDVVFKTNGSENMRLSNATGNLVLGSGDGTGTVAGNTLRAPNGSGTNITGADLTITPGNGTGTGGSGNLIFQTASIGSTGGTANTMTEKLRITNTGAIAIGGASNYGTSGNVIQSGGNGSPTWGALTLSNANSVTGVLPVENGGTGLTSTGSEGTVLTIIDGVPTWQSPATSGTVASVSSVNLSPLFTTSVANSSSTPAISYSLTNSGAETIFGNNTGSSAVPAYFTPTLASALFANQGTTTTILHGNAGGNPSWAQVGLTTDVTGILPVAHGGTGAATLTSNGIIYGNGTSAVGATAAGSSGQLLTVNGSNVPVWTTATYPATTTADQLLYSSSANTVTGIPIGTNNQVLAVISGVPTWISLSTTLNTVTLTNNTATGIAEISLPAGSACGGMIVATIIATNGTDYQSTTEYVSFAGVNKAGTYSTSINNMGDGQMQVTTNGGNVSASFTITTGSNMITINDNSNSSLSSPTVTITFTIMEETGKTVTIL